MSALSSSIMSLLTGGGTDVPTDERIFIENVWIHQTRHVDFKGCRIYLYDAREELLRVAHALKSKAFETAIDNVYWQVLLVVGKCERLFAMVPRTWYSGSLLPPTSGMPVEEMERMLACIH